MTADVIDLDAVRARRIAQVIEASELAIAEAQMRLTESALAGDMLAAIWFLTEHGGPEWQPWGD